MFSRYVRTASFLVFSSVSRAGEPSNELFIMEGLQEKSAFWFESECKQIAARPMQCFFVSQKCKKRVKQGVAYQLIGSFEAQKVKKKIDGTLILPLPMLSRLSACQRILVISTRFGIADKSKRGSTMRLELREREEAQWDLQHKEIQLLYHFPRISFRLFFRR